MLNAFDGKRADVASLRQRSTICVLFIKRYLAFLIFLMVCQCSPSPVQAQTVDPRKFRHEMPHSRFVTQIGLIHKDMPRVGIGLQECIEFSAKGICHQTACLSPLFSFLSGVGKKVVGKSNSESDEKCDQDALEDHIAFWIIFWLGIMLPMFCFWSTEHP